MLNSNDILEKEYEMFKRAFVMNAKDVHKLIQNTFNCCTLSDLMEYMVEDKLVKSKVTFLKLFNSTRECFEIFSVEQDDERPEIIVIDIIVDRLDRKVTEENNENNR